MKDSRVIEVTGRAVPVIGDNIDTDRIIPARFLKEITFGKLGEYPFFDERFNADGSPKAHAFNEPTFQGAAILLANANFGCGSSREHAPKALIGWGIRAIVAESFADIFSGNCAMLGAPAVVASKDDVARLQALAAKQPATEFAVDLARMRVHAGSLSIPVTMPASRRLALLEGMWDTTGMLLANADKAKETSERLLKMLA